jgi:hypothetical protein
MISTSIASSKKGHIHPQVPFYAVEEQMPPNSTVSISVILDSGVEVKLYRVLPSSIADHT